jgi:hypothetical protein
MEETRGMNFMAGEVVPGKLPITQQPSARRTGMKEVKEGCGLRRVEMFSHHGGSLFSG